MGSFDPIYRSVEPLDELDATYFNQAHSEYLEIWLEAGWPGVAIVLAFLIWFGRRSWAIWRSGPGSEADFARAASVGILTILVHSVAEYPLRTVTMMATLALLCAIVERAGAPSIAVKNVGAPKLDPPPPVLRDGELVS
jgi:O-antigen ligase